MKNAKFLTMLLFSSVILFYGCNDSKNLEMREDSKAADVSNTATPTPVATEAGQNPQGVWHYTCGQGCAGGSGTAVNCSTCGNLLAHNQAYHSNVDINADNATPPPATPEPSQNTAGVWHYTCAKGCEGGAGAVGSCGTCGGALAHNAAYHQ